MSSSKNVLFISYDGMTDPLGQSQVIPYLQGISKAGYRIFLLSCEKKEVFPAGRPGIELILAGYNITWIPVNYTKKPPVLSTVWDIWKLKKKAREIHRQYRIDMVHTRPGIPALVGLWLKKEYGIKFLNDIREFFADSRVEGGMWDTKNLLYKSVYNFFKKKERQSVQSNDGIVCLTRAAQNIIEAWPEFQKGTPVKMIPCSVDLDLFDPDRIESQNREHLKTALGIREDDLVISYLGSIGGWYMTTEMLQFCKLLSVKIPLAKFLFISPHRHEVILEAAKKNGLDTSKIIVQKAGRMQVPLLLSLSDYSIFFIKPCYSKLSSSPTKHGEIMAMGIPVITNSGVGDVKEIVEQYEAGYVLDEFSEAAYNKIIDQMIAQTAFAKDLIKKGAAEIYALNNAVNSYVAMYSAILKI